MAQAVVFPELAPLDGALVIAVLLAATGIEPPRLDRRARRRGDMDVTPRRRYPQRVDPRERAFVANDAIVRVDYAEPAAELPAGEGAGA